MTRQPLPVLLSHVLFALGHEYDKSKAYVPPLPYLMNLLRVLDTSGTDLKVLPGAARLSVRAIRDATKKAERAGWLVVDNIGRGQKTVKLSIEGDELMKTGTSRLKAAEATWQKRFGKGNMQQLRTSLAAIVGQLDIELPHYPSSYGQGDTSIHGGNYVESDAKSLRVPAHGAEWPVVIREDRSVASQMSLCGLLSQVLCAFTIDYDANAESSLAGLHTVLTFLQYADDAGMAVAEAKRLGGVNGSGRSTLERHKLVVVESGAAILTPHGRRVRDRYPARVLKIEDDWCGLYGREHVSDLRASLEHFDNKIDLDVPDYIDVSGWLRHRL